MNNDTIQTVTINNNLYTITVGRIIDQIQGWGMDPTNHNTYTNYFGIWKPRAEDIILFYRMGRR